MRYFIRSLSYAWQGIVQFFLRERNGQIQGVLALLVIAAGAFFGITKTEWLAILGCTALVISLEMLNSAIEKVCNMYTTEFHPAIKTIKDVAAAAVLWSAVFSLVIGCIIFLPYISRLFA
ncbi:MAG TPA: diacylglycerol kinase family protein [Flavisolibacter sp.]|jgi:diacylglycerol kinase|nr:diacylglycerol kinase family protein [Flavisolibacter sp.]